MDAALVFDGHNFAIPKTMGKPLPDQCQGTELEVLGEVASRICYDSLGLDEEGKRRGRSSAALHEHILQVKNHSVYEHANVTIGFNTGEDDPAALIPFINRKGVWFELTDEGFEVTINLRVILEWERNTGKANKNHYTEEFGRILRRYGNDLAPMIFPEPSYPSNLIEKTYHKLMGLNADQAWITLWLYGSRGFTHEQVRHRFAMSQRSTRYVDENQSPYIEHPLVTEYLNDAAVDREVRHKIRGQIGASILGDKATYMMLVAALQDYCMKTMGLEKQPARKQARGAARGYLGNALASEMLYSAPVSGWLWILSQRKNKLADAEIREVYTPGLEALKSSHYSNYFGHLNLVPSPDGLGTVLA